MTEFNNVPWPEELLDLLRSAPNIAVMTGAGASAESGVPTFRDALTGLWAKYNPIDLATPEAFKRNPTLVSQWYDQRRCAFAVCQPNAGHLALARLQKKLRRQGRQFTLITQNIDRLHQAAGSVDVVELHGALMVWRCAECGIETEEHGPAFEVYPPRCPCGGRKRPAVVWFNETLPVEAFQRAEAAAEACDLFISVGTSSVVYPAAGLLPLAGKRHARILEINPKETAHSSLADWACREPSGKALPGLMYAAFGADE